eukprot:7042643-Pyramimonas_sp.AAC.1
MLYLAYISADSLNEVTKLALAVDLSLAALLGEDIYNFGELIAHPVVRPTSRVLGDSKGGVGFRASVWTTCGDGLLSPKSSYGWLKDLLVAFNAGDLDEYDALCTSHAAALNAQPALVQNERRLREKITILCLMEIIFRCAEHGGAFPEHGSIPCVHSSSRLSPAVRVHPIRVKRQWLCTLIPWAAQFQQRDIRRRIGSLSRRLAHGASVLNEVIWQDVSARSLSSTTTCCLVTEFHLVVDFALRVESK